MRGLWTWATTDPDAGAPPARPPRRTNTLPLDAVWGLPQDALPQRVELVPTADLWVRQEGPCFASPGDTLTYAVTVGNSGERRRRDVVVHDLLPAEVGAGDLILGNLTALEPGDTWSGVALRSCRGRTRGAHCC